MKRPKKLGSTVFLFVKSIHIIAVISWMAGLLYLPRLFVYHSEASQCGDKLDTFKVMEFRLLKYIMTPAMFVVWLSGFWLVFSAGYWFDFWFLSKFVLVLAMSGVHGVLSRERRRLEDDMVIRSSRFYRIINEIPTVLMIFIVFFVVFKPI